MIELHIQHIMTHPPCHTSGTKADMTHPPCHTSGTEPDKPAHSVPEDAPPTLGDLKSGKWVRKKFEAQSEGVHQARYSSEIITVSCARLPAV